MRLNLINAREAKGLTQAQLGKMVGLKKPSICGIERGYIESRPTIWDKLEAVLGVDQRELRKIDCSSGVKSNAD